MTALEVFEVTTQGGGTDFADVVRLCEGIGAYCLIGGLAVNCYAEPVYTMDADLVMVADGLDQLPARLVDSGFAVETFPYSVNALRGGSQLRIRFTKDPRYEPFPARASRRTVLDQPVMVAALEDVFQGKLWAWWDASRRLTKRKKDELDLLRLAEAYPTLRSSLPQALREMLL